MKVKYITSLSVLSVLVFSACADLDKDFESGVYTSSGKNSVVEDMPSRSAGELNGLYNMMAGPNACGYETPDDGGYPLVCAFFDFNGPDAFAPSVGYNWLSTSSEWTDRHDNYRNPRIRWDLFWKQMKAANDIISGIDPNTESEGVRQLLGQALCVRAFDYLNLAPYYQYGPKEAPDGLCVPLIDGTTAYTGYARNTVSEVYDFILKDLNKAVECLEGYARPHIGFANQAVAYGLRARANLYMENWAAAASDAAKAIEVIKSLSGETCDGEPYSPAEISNPTTSFHSFDHSWIWGIRMTETMADGDYGTWPSWIGSFSTNAYSAGAQVYDCINSLLWSIIPETDARKGWWVDEKLHSDHLKDVVYKSGYSNQDDPDYLDLVELRGDDIAKKNVPDIKLTYLPYTNVKFGFNPDGDLSKNGGDFPIMRVEEMILIQAEGYAKAGDEAKGKKILEDFVKTYRNPEYTQYCKNFSDEVWMQRRIELWGEGFSMSDIMRLRKPMVRFNSRMESNIDDDFKFNLAHEDPIMLAIIPQGEMNSNNLMVQNPIGNEPKSGDGNGLLDGVTD